MNRSSSLGRSGPLIIAVAAAVVVVVVGAIALFTGPLATRPGGSPTPAPTQIAAAPSAPATSAVASVSPGPDHTIEPLVSPTATFGPDPASSPTPVPSPASTVLPSAIPTPAAPSPPTASPTAAPTSPPAQTAFRRVDSFPLPGETVTSIVAGGPGFVAVGYAESPTEECPYRLDGRIWTSVDGETWTPQATGALDETRMWGVVNSGGALFAFGYVGIPGDCAVPDGFGNNVWWSSDGIAWTQITAGITVGSEHDGWNDVAVAGDTLVVVGRFGEAGDGPSRGGVWTSTNGVDWQAADRTPRTHELVSVAAMGETVVAFGQDNADGLAWHSQDAGRTWGRGSIETGYSIWQADVVAADGQFVAVARACCGLPEHSVGLSLTSTDGRVWSAGAQPEAHRYGADRVTTVPGGLLAATDSTETRLSTDGLRWFSGPSLGTLTPESGFVTAAAAGPTGVVIAAYHRLGEEWVATTWFAPLEDVDPTTSTAPAEAADWPVIGQRYAYELYTHCGAANTRVVFAGSVWLMDESTLEGRFGDPGDRGWLTQLSADRALYEGRRGGNFNLDRTDTSPAWPRCA